MYTIPSLNWKISCERIFVRRYDEAQNNTVSHLEELGLMSNQVLSASALHTHII